MANRGPGGLCGRGVFPGGGEGGRRKGWLKAGGKEGGAGGMEYMFTFLLVKMPPIRYIAEAGKNRIE